MTAFPQTQFIAGYSTFGAQMAPPQSSSINWSGVAEGLQIGGNIASIFGAFTGAIGSYYSLKSQQNQLKMQAQNAAFAAQMTRINRRAAEFTATQVGQQGQAAAGQYTMRAGQARAGARTGMAARGIALGQGTAKEVVASMDLVKEIDRLAINASTVRAQEAARFQAFNLGTQATMAELSSRNLSSAAGTIMPGFGAATSLLGSASISAPTGPATSALTNCCKA